MALEIKGKIQIDVGGQVIWFLDDTGAYDANNVGGWGDPNPERNEKALMIYAKRDTDTDPVVSNIISSQAVWNASLLNTDVSEFQITIDQDGVYNMYLFALKVSQDGINDEEGVPLSDGDVVFYQGEIQIRSGGTLSVMDPANYDQLIDDSNIPQVLCTDIIFPNILIQYNKEYKEYRQKRLENCENIEDDLIALLNFHQDIVGMEYLFRSNLQIQARKALEELHNEHSS